MALTANEAAEAVYRLRLTNFNEINRLLTINDFVRGEAGRPPVPDNSTKDVKDIAKLSVKNLLSVVRDTFTQSLLVTGFRNVNDDTNAPEWGLWKQNRMGDRQQAVHRAAITYGYSFVIVRVNQDTGVVELIPRSPVSCIAVYADIRVDSFPILAVDTWVQYLPDGTPTGYVALYDEENIYTFQTTTWLMPGYVWQYENRYVEIMLNSVSANDLVSTQPHGCAHVPVVRFKNIGDADGLSVGEIEHLITLQRQINSTNFDRILVSRFGAFPSKVISGWTELSTYPEARSRITTGPDKIMAFGDDVKATSFMPADLDPYTNLIQEQMEHLATVAQLSPTDVIGKVVNVSADAIAAAEATKQRKLNAMRLTFGESWKQMLELAASLDAPGYVSDPDAEVVWADSESRSFASVVDGVTKLVAIGVPLDTICELIPGLSPLQVAKIKDSVQDAAATSRLQQILSSPVDPSDPSDAVMSSPMDSALLNKIQSITPGTTPGSAF